MSNKQGAPGGNKKAIEFQNNQEVKTCVQKYDLTSKILTQFIHYNIQRHIYQKDRKGCSTLGRFKSMIDY